MLPTKFQVNQPFGSEEETKNRFSRWMPRRQVTPMLPTKFWVNWPFTSGQEAKIDFQDGCHGGHLGFPIKTILATFQVQVTPMLPTKFRVNWPFGSEEEAKNTFSRWPPWRPPWISDRSDFSYFWSTSHPGASYQVSSRSAFQFRRRIAKNIFSRWRLWRQVTPMFPTKFWVSWPFGSGEEVKTRFSRWLPWRPAWISDQTILATFDVQVTPMLPTKFRVKWPFGSREEAENRFSRWRPWGPSLISYGNDFSYFFIYKITQMLSTKFRVNWPRGVGGAGF